MGRLPLRGGGGGEGIKGGEASVARTAPKGSYSDSDRLAKPEMPPYCRSVGMRERRPVRILWG